MQNVLVECILRLLFIARIAYPVRNTLRALYTYVGRPIERTDILFCSATAASVALGATQVQVLACAPPAPELTRWKRVAGQMLLARRARKLFLAGHTCVGRTIEGMDILLCSAIVTSVALGAT